MRSYLGSLALDPSTDAAELDSPTFTGDPKAPTPSPGDNDTTIATTAFVQTAADAKVSDTAYAGSWDTVTTVAPSKNATYDQMELRAPKASPTFTGTVTLPNDQALAGNPTATTQAQGNSSTRLATTAYVQTEAGLLIPKSLLDANSVLYAVTDDTPAALAMGASTILARLAAGNIVAATPTQVQTLLGGPTVSRRSTLTNHVTTGTAMEQWGTEELVFDDALWPGAVTVQAWCTGVFVDVDSGDFIEGRLGISIDNGSTWTYGTSSVSSSSAGATTDSDRNPVAFMALRSNVTPTGDIQVRAEVQTPGGAGLSKAQVGSMMATVRPAHASDN